MNVTVSYLKEIIREEIHSLSERSTGWSHRYVAPSKHPGPSTPGRVVPAGQNPWKEIYTKVEELLGPYIKELYSTGRAHDLETIDRAVSDLIIGKGELRKKLEEIFKIAEVSSEKQRRWACAQKDKAASERADSLSAAEAEEMCTSKIEEDD